MGFPRALASGTEFDVHDPELESGALEKVHVEQKSLHHNSKCMAPILQGLQTRNRDSDRHD